jgi:glycine/D-amino acid oxidase-like deaminating enzyme
LRAGRPIWARRRARAVPHVRLGRDQEVDVVVVGAGITGAMLADALASPERRVAVVDRRGPANGSTMASTALVQYEIDTPLISLGRKIGKRDAARAWRRSRLAVDALAARLDELGVPDVVRRDTLYLAGNGLDTGGLERECAARRSLGLAGRIITRRELRLHYGIRAAAALMSYGDLAIDPRKATCALLDAACRRGARIYAPADIVTVDAGKTGVTATAANGRQIHARHLVFATGYELPSHVQLRDHKITSTWVIATVPQRRRLWPGQCLIWQAADPYLYLRTTSDGRVICGGEDEDFSDAPTRDALLPRKTRTLQRKLGRLMPALDTTVDYAWTGSFGESRDGLPTIGAIRTMPNCWIALGYGGNGTTYSRIAADIIAGALDGTPDIDADLYDFR